MPIPCCLQRLLLLVITLPLFSFAAVGRAKDTPAAAIARFDFNAALALLEKAGAHLPDAPAAERLHYASALLSAQPRTTARIDTALSIARSVATPEARYLEARILHEHRSPRQPFAALVIYRQIAADPDALQHRLLRRSIIHIAQIHLHETPPPGETETPRTREQRLAAAEALLTQAAPYPTLARDLHFLIAQTRLDWNFQIQQALAHLQAAARTGFAQKSRQINLLVTIGQIAEQTGDVALAIDSYRQFLQHTSRDTRADIIRDRLAALENQHTATP